MLSGRRFCAGLTLEGVRGDRRVSLFCSKKGRASGAAFTVPAVDFLPAAPGGRVRGARLTFSRAKRIRAEHPDSLHTATPPAIGARHQSQPFGGGVAPLHGSFAASHFGGHLPARHTRNAGHVLPGA